TGLGTIVLICTRIPQAAVLSKWLLSALAVVASVLLATGCYYTWYRLTVNYYVRLRHAYDVIKEIEQQKTRRDGAQGYEDR
ncbi:MAG TPA: hypothetical protein VM223_11515, partial [Planctomycetota bacterium]|nr:hypothetical protein [Planctomycetota bacterium]